MCMSCFCAWQIFLPIYNSEEIIISCGLRPFDICYDNPILWNYIKKSFIILYSFYTYFDMKLFHNLQGSKLKIKQKTEV